MAGNDGAESKVGYRKPPAANRFKKGQSGNPKGRPRKMAKSLQEEIMAIMQRRLKAKEGDRILMINGAQALAKSMFKHATAGNIAYTKAVIDLMEANSPPDEPLGQPAIERGAREELIRRLTRMRDQKPAGDDRDQ